MAEMSLDPIMEKIISFCFRYLEDQVRWKKRTKEELRRLREKYPKIQAVVHFASSQEQITDKNPALNEWLWQLQDAIDDANDVVDDLEYMEHEKQLTKNKKLRRVRSIMKSMKKKLDKIGNRVIKRDPNLKRLDEAVQKLDEVSADVTNFLHLLDSAKQEQKEQEVDFYRTRETGYLPKNDLIGRLKDKESVVQWLRKPSNEPRTTWYGNISLLSIVGHGGMGKTTLLQHVYEDEIIRIRKESRLAGLIWRLSAESLFCSVIALLSLDSIRASMHLWFGCGWKNVEFFELLLSEAAAGGLLRDELGAMAFLETSYVPILII